MLIKMQVGEQDRGELQVNVTDSDNAPIRDARVTISEPETAINPNRCFWADSDCRFKYSAIGI